MSALILLPILFILLILFVPPISKPLVRYAVETVLGHRLVIDSYFFNPTRLRLSGRFDDNSTIDIDAADLLLDTRHASVRLTANARLFSKLAETDLPNIPFNANADYRNGKAELFATLLDGTLNADMDVASRFYTYTLSDLDIGTFLELNKLPAYTSGTINTRGVGFAADGYYQEANITSNNINLKAPLLSLAELPSLQAPVASDATINFQFKNGSLLKISSKMTADPASVSVNDATYDIRTGAWTLNTFISNNSIIDIPVRRVNVLALGTLEQNDVSANAVIETETYRSAFSNLNFSFDQQHFASDYRFSTLSSEPLNLSGANMLFGHIDYRPASVSVTTSSEKLGVPINVTYTQDKLAVISNNIPLASLLEIGNVEPLATADLNLSIRVDMHKKQPAIEAHLATENLMPSTAIADDLNLSAPLQGKLSVTTGNDRNYHSRLNLMSQFFEQLHIQADLDPKRLTAAIEGNATEFTLPFYRANTMKLSALADFNRSRITDLQLETAYSSVQVPLFEYGRDMHGSLTYSIGGLNRFFKEANASLRADGNATVSRSGKQLSASLHTKHLGTYTLNVDGKSGTLKGQGLALQPVLSAIGHPRMLKGNLSLDGTLSPDVLTLNLHSDSVVPLEELNATLRPFAFDTVVNVARCSSRFMGKVTVSTPYERLELSALDLDLFARRFGADYILQFDDTANSALRLPSNIIGDRLRFKGKVSLTPARQDITLRSNPIGLASSVHAILEANATTPLPVTLDLNASHTKGDLVLRSRISTPYFTIYPLNANYDLNRSHVVLKALVETDRYLGNTALDFNGTFDTNSSMLKNSELGVHAGGNRLYLNHLAFNPSHNALKSDIDLHLTPLNSDTNISKAHLTGDVSIHYPAINGYLKTESFGGTLVAEINEALFYTKADNVNLATAASFFAPAVPLEKGRLDARILLNTSALLEQNLSDLEGGIDISARNVLLEGIEFDSYLETLRNTQDLSLFQGSVGDLPIIRSVKNIPSNIVNTKKIQTHIPNARAAIALKNGIATCDDCALATDTHRLAFAGDINVSSRRFSHFYFALIDPVGCPYFMQQVKGPLTRPEVNVAASGVKVVGGAVVSLASNVTDAASWLTGAVYKLTSATGDIISYVPIAGGAVDKTLNTVTGTLDSSVKTVSGCTPFYLGSVPHPTSSK